MDVSVSDVGVLTRIVGLPVPASEFDEIGARLTYVLSWLDRFETEVGNQLLDHEPIPPVGLLSQGD